MQPTHMLCFLTLASCSVLLAPFPPDPGEVNFAQACLDASRDTVVLNVAAHPDDEAARTTTMWRHAHGARTFTLYTTCGGGGQNAVGREIGERLAGIRIRETHAAAKHTGTEVGWLGFRDFGYSKTRAETLEFWGGGEVLLERMRRVLDEVQPDVVFTNHGLVRGHGHHRASAWAIRTICEERGTPLFERVFVGPATIEFDGRLVDPVRGCTYAKQAHDGLREHRTQGPWSAHDPLRVKPDRWKAINAAAKALGDDVAAMTPTVFDDTDFGNAVRSLDLKLPELRSAFDGFRLDGPRTRSEHVAVACRLLPAMTQIAAAMSGGSAKARARVEQRIDALRRVIVVGARISVEVELANREALSRGATAEAVVRLVRLAGANEVLDAGAALLPAFAVRVEQAGAPTAMSDEGVATCSFVVPATLTGPVARWTESVSMPLRIEFELAGLPLSVERSIEVPLGPALRASWPRPAIYVPVGRPWQRDLSITVEALDAVAATHRVRFRVPAGVAVETLAGDATVPVTVAPGETESVVRIRVRGDGSQGQRFDLRARVGDASPVQINVQPVDAVAATSLRVALVRGPDDTVELALRDLGVAVTTLDEAALAAVDLADFTTLLLDIRAYHHRPDLAQHRERIFAFCEAGGRVLVSYHKPREWNETEARPSLAPRELVVGRQRVSQEDAAVEFVEPSHFLLNKPFAIDARADFEGWVQERGLNFIEKWDPDWQTVLRMHDEGERPLEGSLLVTQMKRGSYVYCALALYRQLRVGHAGAARLLVNLLTP